MNLTPLWTAFITVFLAELGDKTQLATLTLASSSNGRWQILVGASLALILSTVIAVTFAEALGRILPPHVLKKIAGMAFLILGILYLRESFQG